MNGAFTQFAEALLDLGYSPLPIIPGTKKPALREWSNFCAAPMPLDRVQSYGARWPRASLGIALGFNGIIALDIDSEDPAQLAAICAAVPMSPVRKAGKKGSTSFFRAAPGIDIPSRHFATSRKQGICDLLSTGAQTVLPPSPHPAGHAYRWLTVDTLLSIRAADLPEVPANLAGHLETALAPWLPQREFHGPATPRFVAPEGFEKRRLIAFAKSGLARRARDLASTAEGGRNNELFSLGASLGRYVFHGLLSPGALEKAAIAACEANGLLRDDGRLALLATLHSGTARAKDDPLPVLKERRTA